MASFTILSLYLAHVGKDLNVHSQDDTLMVDLDSSEFNFTHSFIQYLLDACSIIIEPDLIVIHVYLPRLDAGDCTLKLSFDFHDLVFDYKLRGLDCNLSHVMFLINVDDIIEFCQQRASYSFAVCIVGVCLIQEDAVWVLEATQQKLLLACFIALNFEYQVRDSLWSDETANKVNLDQVCDSL